MQIAIVVPTLNPGRVWDAFSSALSKNLRNLKLAPSQVVVLDSDSDDDVVRKANAAGFTVLPIQRDQFDHGGTRQFAVERKTDAEFLVFLTQDAVLASPDAIRTLLQAFNDPAIAAAYGRQLPRLAARGIEAHGRLFSYPAASRVRSMEDRESLGFKSIFASNAFCAFRRKALVDVGGFPSHAICSEETIAIASMHMAGWKSAYVAEAQVYHSHPFTVAEEFRRYFDVGVTHARHPFLVEIFGTASGEGKRFVLSELRYLLRHRPSQLPTALFRTLTKLAGYRMGRREEQFNLATCRRLSLNRGFWKAENRLPVYPAPAVIPETPSLQAQRLALEKASHVIKQDLKPGLDLRPAAQAAAEVARVPAVPQQRL